MYSFQAITEQLKATIIAAITVIRIAITIKTTVSEIIVTIIIVDCSRIR
jgi:hypothetical protein